MSFMDKFAAPGRERATALDDFDDLSPDDADLRRVLGPSSERSTARDGAAADTLRDPSSELNMPSEFSDTRIRTAADAASSAASDSGVPFIGRLTNAAYLKFSAPAARRFATVSCQNHLVRRR